MDVERFFPERGMPGRRTAAVAIAVCLQCPVQAACLDWALATNERYGIWGGRSERDRRRMRYAEFTQLELLPPLEREPRRRRRRLGQVRAGRLRGVRVVGQLAFEFDRFEQDSLFDDDRFGIFGVSAPRTKVRTREAS